jgi:hypothetical protein
MFLRQPFFEVGKAHGVENGDVFIRAQNSLLAVEASSSRL